MFTDCMPIVSGSTWSQRSQAQTHCRRAYDNPMYCDPFFGGRKKRSATLNQTIVSPTLSGIKKDRKPPIKTDFNTTMPGMSGNRTPPPLILSPITQSPGCLESRKNGIWKERKLWLGMPEPQESEILPILLTLLTTRWSWRRNSRVGMALIVVPHPSLMHITVVV